MPDQTNKDKMLEHIILQHFRSHPKAELTDIAKLIYQSEFGCGHLVKDEGQSLSRLTEEIRESLSEPADPFSISEGMPGGQAGRPADDLPEGLAEEIGNGLCRMHLRPASRAGISTGTLNRFFVYTAGHHNGHIDSFRAKWKEFRQMCEARQLPFDPAEADRYFAWYEAAGFPAVSHSDSYRSAYRPAYRVVSSAFAEFFPLFVRLDRLLASERSQTLTAIDGNSGAGKSVIGGLIREIYDCNLFHTDDYFLRPEQRTPERSVEPGGNVDYERLEEEIYSKVALGHALEYRKFDCSAMALGDTVRVSPKKLNIIEGSYSLHPRLSGYCDLKVFLGISPEEQAKRILRRNGPAMYRRFAEGWIPKENRYFQFFAIEKQCDLVFKF